MNWGSAAYDRQEDNDAYAFSQEISDMRDKKHGDPVIQAYMRDVRKFPLLTPAQEFELGKIIEPLILVRQQIKKTNAELSICQARHAKPELAKKVNGLACELAELRRQESAIWETAQFQDARNALVSHNLRWVITLAKRFMGRGIPLKDLVQEGNLGLMKAAEKYEWRRGFRFCTYSAWWIRQTIARAIADDGVVRMPTYMVELLPKVMALREDFIAEHGCEPNHEYLAERCERSAAMIERVLTTGNTMLSLESSDDEPDVSLQNILADERQDVPGTVELTLLREKVTKIVNSLQNPREREIIKRRFGLGKYLPHTLEEIAEVKGLSRERIRQIENAVLRKLGMSQRKAVLEGFM